MVEITVRFDMIVQTLAFDFYALLGVLIQNEAKEHCGTIQSEVRISYQRKILIGELLTAKYEVSNMIWAVCALYMVWCMQ